MLGVTVHGVAVVAANNGWHLEPFVDGYGPVSPFTWLLVAVVAGWALRRWWHHLLEDERRLRERRQRETQRIVDAALRQARAKESSQAAKDRTKRR